MLSLLSSYACLENISKQPECLGKVLGVEIWHPTIFHFRNIPKTFGMFRKVFASIRSCFERAEFVHMNELYSIVDRIVFVKRSLVFFFLSPRHWL